jgi:hypothetical protein
VRYQLDALAALWEQQAREMGRYEPASIALRECASDLRDKASDIEDMVRELLEQKHG